jgi:hypothetical protein
MIDRRTSVVLNPRVDVLGGNVYWLLAVDRDVLVLCCIIGRPRGNPEYVLFVMRHCMLANRRRVCVMSGERWYNVKTRNRVLDVSGAIDG